MTKAEWYIIGKKNFILQVNGIYNKFVDKFDTIPFEYDGPPEGFNKAYNNYVNKIMGGADKEINSLKNKYKLKFAGITGLSAIALLAIGLFAKYIHKKRKEMRAKLELEKERLEKKSKSVNEGLFGPNYNKIGLDIYNKSTDMFNSCIQEKYKICNDKFKEKSQNLKCHHIAAIKCAELCKKEIIKMKTQCNDNTKCLKYISASLSSMDGTIEYCQNKLKENIKESTIINEGLGIKLLTAFIIISSAALLKFRIDEKRAYRIAEKISPKLNDFIEKNKVIYSKKLCNIGRSLYREIENKFSKDFIETVFRNSKTLLDENSYVNYFPIYIKTVLIGKIRSRNKIPNRFFYAHNSPWEMIGEDDVYDRIITCLDKKGNKDENLADKMDKEFFQILQKAEEHAKIQCQPIFNIIDNLIKEVIQEESRREKGIIKKIN